ncbi:hypothetical protein EVAR_59268_1 [Eumeta japonica]|uniref:Uncharacterized protein n=1 Tax=Eumeta variegata TaxID=151549 RepID=A0A4C1YIW1_EUMVA|nr:hypothetical protein EVAR_59268_1 [Eumeta japonica]
MLKVVRLYSIVDFKHAKVANEISPRYTRGRYRARWDEIRRTDLLFGYARQPLKSFILSRPLRDLSRYVAH